MYLNSKESIIDKEGDPQIPFTLSLCDARTLEKVEKPPLVTDF